MILTVFRIVFALSLVTSGIFLIIICTNQLLDWLTLSARERVSQVRLNLLLIVIGLIMIVSAGFISGLLITQHKVMIVRSLLPWYFFDYGPWTGWLIFFDLTLILGSIIGVLIGASIKPSLTPSQELFEDDLSRWGLGFLIASVVVTLAWNLFIG